MFNKLKVYLISIKFYYIFNNINQYLKLINNCETFKQSQI